MRIDVLFVFLAFWNVWSGPFWWLHFNGEVVPRWRKGEKKSIFSNVVFILEFNEKVSLSNSACNSIRPTFSQLKTRKTFAKKKKPGDQKPQTLCLDIFCGFFVFLIAKRLVGKLDKNILAFSQLGWEATSPAIAVSKRWKRFLQKKILSHTKTVRSFFLKKKYFSLFPRRVLAQFLGFAVSV